MTLPEGGSQAVSADVALGKNGQAFVSYVAGETPALFVATLPELVADGIDQNCDGVDGTDADGDGYAAQGTGGSDVDDTDANVH